MVLAVLPCTGQAQGQENLAAGARDVLKAHCSRCHSPEGTVKGGFDYVLRRDLLVARGKLVPGKPGDSEILQRIRDGDMPPKKEKNRPGREELAVLEQWLTAGAPDWRPAGPPPKLVAESDLLRAIRGDLEALPEPQRRFARYFTVANVVGAGRPEEGVETVRLALAKLLNALSFHPRLAVPVAIDGSKTVYRIDLRDYKWNSRLWEKLVAVYPYRIPHTGGDARVVAYLTGTEQALLRADWFIATASRTPLYYDLLQLPLTDRSLERLLQVEAAANLEELNAARSGFNGSGVSKNNRILERHDAAAGAYWKTYDFAENIDRQNIFDRPLGPPPARNSFVPSGGEMIFHLPNGLHGYFLIGDRGQRLDKAPVEIVSDPERPDKIVEAGVSCFGCHAAGIIPKGDQVRAHVLKNAKAFAKDDVETVKALYPPESKLKSLIDEDNKRFLEALKKLGIKPDGPEPIRVVTQQYEGVVDLASAAAELGLKADDLGERLAKSAELGRALGALRAQGGTVQRDALIAAFPIIVREFRLGEVPSTPVAGGAFTGHTGAIGAVAVSADGKRALSGSDDRTLRLWAIESGKELGRFEGHRGAVTAAAFSPDGKQAISGSEDRTVRVWDLSSGKQARLFQGHTDTITALAFAPDGQRILSGGHDRTIRLWDVATGKELTAMSGHTGKVGSVAFAPDGKLAASGSHDQTVRIWDVPSGREVRVLHGSAGEIYSVAFAPDGRSIAAGGNDRMVRLWDLEGGFEVRRFEGHGNAVVRIVFAPDGKQLLSGGSQYQTLDPIIRVWSVAGGKELKQYGGQTRERVTCLAFSADGKFALTDGADLALRIWKLTD